MLPSIGPTIQQIASDAAPSSPLDKIATDESEDLTTLCSNIDDWLALQSESAVALMASKEQARCGQV